MAIPSQFGHHLLVTFSTYSVILVEFNDLHRHTSPNNDALSTRQPMMKKIILLTLLLTTTVATAETIDSFTKDMLSKQGFMNLYWDESKGNVYLKVRANEDFLYVNSLASGVGSNDIGLDRGQLGDIRLVRFERSGPKLFLKQPNLAYRANSDNPMEVKAVEEAFASSIIWGFKIVAQSADELLIDVTDFILRDSHDIAGRLKRTKQGNYKADKSRSGFYLPNSKTFPDNTELEATLTMSGSGAGAFLRSVTPTPEFVTVRTHHSFIRLPDDKYQTRQFDPRTGSYPMSFEDYAVPLGEDMTQRIIRRHRIEDGKPIIYYLDPGTPEPVRSALLEGARWWEQAFAAAGLEGMYRVEMLPEGADPMDVRYNTIQWVHRSTRGWSYGYSISDPRTGEILKGHVTLGSLRVRQDMLIAQGLLSPFKTGDEVAPEIEQMALARLRQLSAHEVGHTLGFAHNFAASAEDRSSVMDYPHPLIRRNSAGELELNDAYDEGIGAWDILSVEYAYREFDDEEAGLQAMLDKIADSNIPFITDQDSRRGYMAHPVAHMWDNGADSVDELAHLWRVRANALQRFGEDTLKNGKPLSELERYLVPIYLLHRYQSQAAVKHIAGVDYSYAIKEANSDHRQTIVASEQQRKALSALLKTIDANQLKLSSDLFEKLHPPAYGFPRDRESFKHRTTPVFDLMGMVETASSLTVSLLLDPYRAARLIQQKAMDEEQLGLYQLQKALLDASWKKQHKDSYTSEVQNAINWTVLSGMKSLASSANASPQVRAMTMGSLRELSAWLKKKHRISRSVRFAYDQAALDIDAFIAEAAESGTLKIQPLPPGSPIGMH